jgi:hypothetical protein
MAVTTEQVQVQVEINGQKAGTTLKDLQGTAKQLRAELRLLPTDTDAFTQKAAELQKVNTQLKEINNSVKAVDQSLEDAGKSGGMFSNILHGAMSVFLGGGLDEIAGKALGAIKDFFVESVTGAQAMNRSFAQLEQALHGNAEAAKELSEQASQLEVSLKGLFSQEDIKDGQTQLALYTDQADQIKKLTPQILDLAAAKGVDLKTAADAVGKSLEGDSNALKKMGISTKDAATEQERFAIITQGLTEKVGGQAQVVADTTKTGWDGLVVKFDEFSKSVGEKIIPIIDSLGNFLSDLWDKSKPVVDIFKSLWDILGQLWDNIKGVIASFGLFNEKGSLATTLMKTLQLSLLPLKLTLQAISFVLKETGEAYMQMLAIANGTIQALVATFTNFKEFVFNVFGSIGKLLEGVFTFDLGKIKEGLEGIKAGYAKMGNEIADAYNKGYNDTRDKQKAAIATQDDKDHKDNLATNQKNAQELADQKLKNDAELNDKLTEQRINAMKDGDAKQTALENLRFQREQKTTADKITELKKLGASQQQINDYTENLQKTHENNLTKIQQEGAAKRKQDQDKIDAQKKKDDDEASKKQEDLNKKLADLYKQVEDIHIAAMQDGEAKQIAQENLRYEREQAAEVQRINDLRKAGADEATIKAENDKFTQDAETQHQNILQDIRIKAAEKQKADAKKTADDLKKENDDAFKKQVEATNQFYDALAIGMKEALNKKIVAEHLTNDQIAAEKEKADTALLQLELQKNEALLEQEKKYGQDTLATENAIADEKMQLAERTANFRKQSEEEWRQIVNDGLQLTIDALSADEAARKKNAAAIKAFSIAQVLISLEKEIQSIWETANASPTNILFPGSGNVIAGIKTALAVGRSALAVSKISRQQFYHGGYTGDDGVDIIMGDPNPVAGVVHSNEWVAPKWMVSHPTYHSVINQLEGVRQRGFAQGGFTTTPVNNISTNLDLMGTENKLDQLINAFKDFPTRLKADVVYTEFETVQTNVADVRNAAQVGK